MTPINFRRANGTLTGGPSQNFNTDEDVVDLPVYRNGKEVMSCWRPSLRERLSVLFQGRVWLRVSTSTAHPPVCLEGRSPFD
jgi:hypothetical protein